MFFNQAPTTEEITKLRQEHKTAKEWVEYCEFFLSDLDLDEQRELKLQENKEAKIKMCGMPCFLLNKKGIPTQTTFRCEICSNCLARQADNIKKAIIDLDQPLRIIKIPEAQRARETRKLRDKNIKYQTFFHENSNGLECHILAATEDKELGKVFNARVFDYSQWINPVKNKRRSGSLLQSVRALSRNNKETNEDNRVLDDGKVAMRRIIPKFDKLPAGFSSLTEVSLLIRKNVILKTFDFAPGSIKELVKCIRQREDLIIDEIEKLGGVILSVEYSTPSTRYITEDTSQEWLDAAQEVLDYKIKQLKL